MAPRLLLTPELLSYHVLRPNHPGHGDLVLLGEAYRCWSDIWKQTFQELDNATSLPSDDFTRQDEIVALFHDWECIGTASLRSLDFMNQIHRDDSYFAIWPTEALSAAAAHGSRVCIVSSFTVAPHWRRSRGGRVRDLLSALAVERFLQLDADVFVATVRNDVGMNTMTYGLGFRPLARNLVHHGVDVDLVAFFRKTCARPPSTPNIEALIAELCPKRGTL